MSEEHEIGELVRRDAMEALKKAARQTGKTKTMLFLSTPSGVLAIKPDPVAADRAKRYLWSRIEPRGGASTAEVRSAALADWRAER